MLSPKKDLEQWGPIDGNVLFPGFWYPAMSHEIHQKWGIGWTDMVVSVKNGNRLTAWWDRKGLEDQGVKGIKKWLISPAKRKVLFEAYKQSRDRFLELNEEVLNSDSKIFKPEMGDRWHRCEMDFWREATVFEIINYGSTIYLREKIKKFVPDYEIENALAVLLAPERPSFHKESEIDLYKVAQGKLGISPYVKKWFWVENSYLESKHIRSNVFLSRIKGLTKSGAANKIAESKKYFKQVLVEKKKISKQYKLPIEIQNLARLLSWSLWVQDERKGVYWKMIAGLEKLCLFVAKKNKIPYKQVIMYSAEAWRDLFVKGKKFSLSEMSQRTRNTVFDSGPNRYEIFFGKKADQIAEKFINRIQHSDSTDLQGVGVSPGKISGRVKILLSPKNLDKLKSGDILVAPMTSPDYILAMRKAKAIITDVGGLTSHAAVVSRELGVPCIVGTKFATKILKDGDMVEVDANKGIVRRL